MDMKNYVIFSSLVISFLAHILSSKHCSEHPQCFARIENNKLNYNVVYFISYTFW